MKTKSMYMFGAAMTGLLLLGNAAQAANDPSESVTITASPSRDFLLNRSDFKSEQVSYSDEDLSRPGGYGRLMVKINNVASRLCDAVRPLDGWNLDQRETCINAAVIDANRQIDLPSDRRLAYQSRNTQDLMAAED